MQTTGLDYKDGLVRGLRNKAEFAKNALALTELDGLRACEHGLAKHVPIEVFWPELVTNGTFTGSADSWTLQEHWTYNANTIRQDCTPAWAYQDIGAVSGGYYLVSFDVVTMIEGDLLTVYLNSTNILTLEGAGNEGTYQFVVQAGAWGGDAWKNGTISFYGAAVGEEWVVIDNVSVKLVSLGSDLVTSGDFAASTGWTIGTGWAIAAGVATHTSGTAVLSQAFPHIELEIDSLYKVVSTVSSRTAGTLTTKLGTGAGVAWDTNATHTEYITCVGNTTLSSTPTTDFDGSLDDVSVTQIMPSDWPFPQLFRGEAVTLMAMSKNFWTVNESNLGGPHTLITTYDARSPGDAKDITGDAPWHFAEFQGVWFAFNGTCLVYNIPSTADSKVVVEDTVRIKTGCTFGDRLLLGNFYASSYFDGDDWAEIWEIWQKYSDDEEFTYLDMAIGKNWVMWSRNLGGDYYRPFGSEMALFQIPSSTAFDNVKARLITDVKNHNIGFTQMPFRGEILHMAQLGDGVIAYGEDGIALMQPTEKGFKTRLLLRTGVEARSMATGDDRNQCFVDRKGNLWYASGDFKTQRLDYKEFLASVIDANAVMSFDSQRNEFYMCKSGEGYVFSEGALSGLRILPTSLITIDDDLVAPVQYVGAPSRYAFVTNVFDMELQFDVKTIQAIHVSSSDITELQVRIQWRDSGSDGWTSEDWVDCNEFGVAVVIATALEFKVGVRGLAGTDPKINTVFVEWKATGKRHVGGLL